MRVSTRIISGFGVLMILASAALLYHVYVIGQLQSVNRELSEVGFRNAEIALDLQGYARNIAEFSEKYFSSSLNRESYGNDLKGWWTDFENNLAKLSANVKTKGEMTEAAQLSEAWNDYRGLWEIEAPQITSGEAANFPLDLAQQLELLLLRSEKVYEAIDTSVTEQVNRAAAMGARAERLSWMAGGIVLFISGVVSFVLLRAINKPLAQLIQGTRMIAQGQFAHRIPTRGRDEFGELARDFNAMSQRLGELDQMKKDFVSHVSHELKAPLASIRQTAHFLLEQIPGPLNDQQKRMIRLSYNSAERLAAMVGNLLDVSRLEAGNMEYAMAPVDLQALATVVAEEFEVQSKDKNVPIRVKTDPGIHTTVSGDRDRMVQVIGNLYDNALKFSPPGTEIVVTIQERTRGSEKLQVVSVADAGPGVEDAHKERVFQKFHQVKHGKKISGQGVGLGLAICLSIIEAHGGRIWVEDNPGGGSIFSFELRAAARVEVTA